MDRWFQQIIEIWNTFIGRATYDNAYSITNASDYADATGFYLYVGVEGNVTATTKGGQTWTKKLVVGFYPIKLVAITGASTTATDLLACK